MAFLGCDAWQLRYQRNNKQSGLKNIRCFPACSNPHKLRGFCGNSISFQPDRRVTFTVSFGEFALRESSTIHVGQIVTAEDIAENERLDDLFKPWHRGEAQEGGFLVFNKQKKGWHYSWVSNKHTSDSEHVFRVYLLEEAGDNAYRCVASYDSPAFTIFCRRRDKSGVDNLPPQFMNTIAGPRTSMSTMGSEEDDEDDEDDEVKPRKRAKASPEAKKHRQHQQLVPSQQHQLQQSQQQRQTTFISRQQNHAIIGDPYRMMAQFVPPAMAPTPPLLPTVASSSSSSSAQLKHPIVQESAMIFRILAALTNVHDRQTQPQSDSTGTDAGAAVTTSSSSTAISTAAPSITSMVPNPTTPSTVEESDDPDADLLDLTRAINDCWDWVSPDEQIGDTQFFDDFFSQPSSKPLEEMLLKLGQYLLKEEFSREIEEIFANKATGGDDSKRQVVRCLKAKFERFFVREGTTLEAFDRDLVANNPQLTEEKPHTLQLLFPTSNARLAFHNPLPVENLFRPPFRIVPNGPHDFTGHWRRPVSTLEVLEKLRSVIGFSWIERKLMLQMEQEFFIWYEGNTMFVRGQRKLAGSNTLIHILDGVDYPFVQPSPMLGDNTPAIGLFNRTWAAEDGSINFVTTYTLEFRTHRRTLRSACGNKLESTITLQRNESCQLPGVWVEICVFPVLAERVTSY